MSVAAASNPATSTQPGRMDLTSRAIQRAYASILIDHDPQLKIARARLHDAQELEEDWDDEGGLPANGAAANLAFDIITKYAATARIQGNSWVRPSINVLNDGSVTLRWMAGQQQLYLTIAPDAQYSLFARQIGQIAQTITLEWNSDTLQAVVNYISNAFGSPIPAK